METMTRLGALTTGPAALTAALTGALGVVVRERQQHKRERMQAARLHEELLAYMRIDDWSGGDAREMGKRLCRTISRHSAFGTAALLVRDAKGRLTVSASLRADELTVCALERWAEGESARQREEANRREQGSKDARGVHLVRLERRSGYRPGDPAALAWCTAVILPMRTGFGEVVGAIAVCADRFHGQPSAALAAALRPLELLAARFAHHLQATQPAGWRGSFEQPFPAHAGIAKTVRAQAPQRARERYSREWAYRQELPVAETTSMPSGPVGRRSGDASGGVSASGHA